MKLYYIASARMPTEKAHGIQIAKMCEAFIEAGVDLTLVVPYRTTDPRSLQEYYGLRVPVPLMRLPAFEAGYRLAAFQLACGAFLFLWGRVFSGERFVVYTVDMDPFSFVPLAFVPRPLFAEMHGVKKSKVLVRYFFTRAGIIATNTLIADELVRTFGISSERLRIEPNGVDESLLHSTVSKEEARRRLGLSNEPFALYVGRVYGWKGLEILSDVAADSPLPLRLLGGTREEYERVTRRSGEALLFAGARPVSEVPLWLAAADVLLVLGTARNDDSYLHTAPMKVFEYLAIGRPVVASKTPSVASIMREDTAFWYKPDDARTLAHAIREAYTSPKAVAMTATGRTFAAEHTWKRRAERILAFMTHGN